MYVERGRGSGGRGVEGRGLIVVETFDVPVLRYEFVDEIVSAVCAYVE